jgi:nitrogen fixation protein NifU and related proteins
MSDLRDLYQEVILDHSKHPRNFGPLPDATSSAEGDNPLCGDHIEVHVRVIDGVVRGVRFEGRGCAISSASASMMTGAVEGRSVAEIDALMALFHAMITARPTGEVETTGLGKLAVFSGVREFPVRVKCATLAWHTLKAALADAHGIVTTETT